MFSLRGLQWGLNETMHFQVKCLAWAELQPAWCKWMHWWNSRWWIAGMILPAHKVRLDIARCIAITWALNRRRRSGFQQGCQLVSAVRPSHKVPSPFRLQVSSAERWRHSTMTSKSLLALTFDNSGYLDTDSWLHLSLNLFLHIFIENPLLPWGLKTEWIFYELNCVCCPPNSYIELLTPNSSVSGWPKSSFRFFFFPTQWL